MDDVIDDIISLQSSYDDVQAYIDPVAQMPNTVSNSDWLNVCLVFESVVWGVLCVRDNVVVCAVCLRQCCGVYCV